MMKALKRYREWNEQRWLKWWERKRAQGRSHFVRRVTLFWSGMMLNSSSLLDYLFDGSFSLTRFVVMLPGYLLAGWLVGASTWSSHERRYQEYLVEGGSPQLGP